MIGVAGLSFELRKLTPRAGEPLRVAVGNAAAVASKQQQASSSKQASKQQAKPRLCE